MFRRSLNYKGFLFSMILCGSHACFVKANSILLSSKEKKTTITTSTDAKKSTCFWGFAALSKLKWYHVLFILFSGILSSCVCCSLWQQFTASSSLISSKKKAIKYSLKLEIKTNLSSPLSNVDVLKEFLSDQTSAHYIDVDQTLKNLIVRKSPLKEEAKRTAYKRMIIAFRVWGLTVAPTQAKEVLLLDKYSEDKLWGKWKGYMLGNKDEYEACNITVTQLVSFLQDMQRDRQLKNRVCNNLFIHWTHKSNLDSILKCGLDPSQRGHLQGMDILCHFGQLNNENRVYLASVRGAYIVNYPINIKRTGNNSYKKFIALKLTLPYKLRIQLYNDVNDQDVASFYCKNIISADCVKSLSWDGLLEEKTRGGRFKTFVNNIFYEDEIDFNEKINILQLVLKDKGSLGDIIRYRTTNHGHDAFKNEFLKEDESLISKQKEDKFKKWVAKEKFSEEEQKYFQQGKMKEGLLAMKNSPIAEIIANKELRKGNPNFRFFDLKWVRENEDNKWEIFKEEDDSPFKQVLKMSEILTPKGYLYIANNFLPNSYQLRYHTQLLYDHLAAFEEEMAKLLDGISIQCFKKKNKSTRWNKKKQWESYKEEVVQRLLSYYAKAAIFHGGKSNETKDTLPYVLFYACTLQNSSNKEAKLFYQTHRTCINNRNNVMEQRVKEFGEIYNLPINKPMYPGDQWL